MRHFLFLALLSTSTVACIAEEPMNGEGDPAGPDAGMPDQMPEEDEGVPLSFAGLPPQTYWDSVPVHGQGPANGSVIVEGSDGTVAIELGGDGSFCLDVPLVKGQLNTLSLMAIDQDGERSDAQVADVLQEGQPPSPGQATPAANIALGGLPIAATTVSVEEGSFAALTDGNLATGALISDALWSYDWMTVQLPISDGVEKLRIYSDVNCPMEEYLVHTAAAVTTDMPAPGTENLSTAPWTFRGHHGSAAGNVNSSNCSTASFACQEYSFESSVVGVVGIRFQSDDCQSFFGVGKHRVHEIQAWTPTGIAPPAIVAPSCQGGL